LDVVSDDLPMARFAYWAQVQLEIALGQIVQRAVEMIGSAAIVLTGGVALNCSANSSLGRRFGLSSFVHALVGDAGTALGAAAFGCRVVGDRVMAVDGPYLGPGWTDDEVIRTLQRLGLRYEVPASLPEAVADLMSQGQIVGWFQGPAEAGPRALGHRSILADPSDVRVCLSVNRIKRREWWRPLAPSLSEDAGQQFCGRRRSRYMLEAVQVSPEGRQALPGVTHVDGSSRVHVVDYLTNERFSELLACLADRTGWAAVLNTSFNIGPEPIVYTPLDAVRTYFGSTLHALAVGPALLRRL
jgi:carbamoyltransferase